MQLDFLPPSTNQLEFDLDVKIVSLDSTTVQIYCLYMLIILKSVFNFLSSISVVMFWVTSRTASGVML